MIKIDSDAKRKNLHKGLPTGETRRQDLAYLFLKKKRNISVGKEMMMMIDCTLQSDTERSINRYH